MLDSHCHLADEAFAADLEQVVSRAQASGVSRALCILALGDAAEFRQASRLMAVWPDARFAIGLHPHSAHQFADNPQELQPALKDAFAREPRAVALGEIGLDYHYDFSPRAVQQAVFRQQVRLARELSLPVVIHTREAEDDTFAILAEEGEGIVRGVFHCFTGTLAMAERAVAIGFLLSFSGILTFPKAKELREVARWAPLDRVLIETDSPFLAPAPHRGGRNEPAHVARVLETLAAVREMPVATLERAIEANFDRMINP